MLLLNCGHQNLTKLSAILIKDQGRQLAFWALKAVHQGTYADVALHRVLKSSLAEVDRRLITELVYGATRQQRTLDVLINQLAQKPADRQPPDLRTLLHLGLYQLRYLDHIPTHAAIHTTVELAKHNRMAGLTGFVNGFLRQYGRLAEQGDPLDLPTDSIPRLGVQYSYPDWIVQVWQAQLGFTETEELCHVLNQPPAITLRINPLQTDLDTVQTQLAAVGVVTHPVPPLPQALEIEGNPGPIHQLPGFEQGDWMVQDASAQLVSHWVNPQPGSVVIDLCAAPGGKTTHMAELMQDQGEIWACDRTPSRLRKLQQNVQRSHLQSVKLWTGDSRNLPAHLPLADYLLVDAPCSGLGTLHRHADARWQQTPDKVKVLAQLQTELLTAGAQQVKPGGLLVYATCTLHPTENEAIIAQFLDQHPNWLPELASNAIATAFASTEGWVKIWPHQRGMDGFFMAALRQQR